MRGLFPDKDLRDALADKVFGRAKRRPSSNSPAHVSGKDTIADPTNPCWCGRPQNHDWPMKEIGAAHPRYPD